MANAPQLTPALYWKLVHLGAPGSGVTLPITEADVTGLVGDLATLTSAVAGKQPSDTDLTAIAALTTTSYGRSLLELANAAALRTIAGLVIGTNVQAWDADLDTLAGAITAFGQSIAAAANAGAARTLLGLVIGTDVQAHDSDLDAIAALTTTSYGRSVLALADAAALRTLAGVVIGTDVQAYDADLTTLAGLTATTDNFIVSVASAWASRTPAQVRTTLALVIGTNVQAWAARLDVLAATTDTGTGAIVRATSPALTTPTGIVKGDVGLGSVDNVADASKPVSTAQAAADALNLKIASNLSDLASAATARTNLGLVIGTNVQAWAAALDTWAGKTAPAGTVVGTSDTQTLTAKTLTSPQITGNNYGLTGDGSDGVINFDGSTTVLGLAPASSVYTLTRDIYLADGSQVSGSAVIKCANFRIFCSGTFTVGASAVVHNDGNAGSSSTAGAATAVGYLAATIGGGAGRSTAGAGTAGTTSTVALGAAGAAGGLAAGGGTGGGTAGGGATAPSALDGLPRNATAAIMCYALNSGFYRGGGGGSGGTCTTSSTSGGGGAGGGIVLIAAQKLVNSGVIRSRGGAGGNASGAGTGAGGGGGGGGGAIIIVAGAGSTTGTLTVTGGTGGSLQGAGAAGATGSTGNTYLLTL